MHKRGDEWTSGLDNKRWKDRWLWGSWVDGRGEDGWVNGGLSHPKMSLLMSQNLRCFSTPCRPAGFLYSAHSTSQPQAYLVSRVHK